ATNQNQALVNWNIGGTGVVTVDITDGGCTSVASEEVIIDSTPKITVSPSSASVCPYSNSVTLKASGATTYRWAPDVTDSTASQVTVTPTVTTVYTVYGTRGGCTSFATDTVKVIDSCVTCWSNQTFDLTLVNADAKLLARAMHSNIYSCKKILIIGA